MNVMIKLILIVIMIVVAMIMIKCYDNDNDDDVLITGVMIIVERQMLFLSFVKAGFSSSVRSA